MSEFLISTITGSGRAVRDSAEAWSANIRISGVPFQTFYAVENGHASAAAGRLVGAVDDQLDREYVAHNRSCILLTSTFSASRPTRFAVSIKECIMTKTPEKKPPMPAEIDPQQVEEVIRRRAYELYEARGYEHGHDFDDWLHAEEEVIQSKARSMAA